MSSHSSLEKEFNMIEKNVINAKLKKQNTTSHSLKKV